MYKKKIGRQQKCAFGKKKNFTCCKFFPTTHMFTNVWFIPSVRSFMHLKIFRKPHGQEINKVIQRLRAHLNRNLLSCMISPSDGEQ